MRGLIELPKLYGSKLVKIPTPQFVVFYNGIITEEQAANNLSISKEEFEKILNEKI